MSTDQSASEYDSALLGWFSAPAKPARKGLTLGSSKKGPEHLKTLERVKAWTRTRFSLPDEAAILVSQITCQIPGCPPLETVVAFWTPDEQGGEVRHHFKLFKPVKEVVEDDLPYAWLKDTLVVSDDFTCECC